MRLTRKIYLLDPVEKTLFALDTYGCKTVADIKEMIDCESVDAIFFDSDHVLYFDDDGLKRGVDHYTMVDGHPDPLVGKLLIMHRELECSVLFTSPEIFLAKLRCYKPVLDPVIETVETVDGNVTKFLSAVTGFDTRIVEVKVSVRRHSLARTGLKFPRSDHLG